MFVPSSFVSTVELCSYVCHGESKAHESDKETENVSIGTCDWHTAAN